MYSAIKGNLDGIKELLDSDVNVNFKDNDGRTAVSLLLDCSSELDPSDCLSGFRNLNTWLELEKMLRKWKKILKFENLVKWLERLKEG